MKLRHKLTLSVTVLTASVIFLSCFLIICQYEQALLDESFLSVKKEAEALDNLLDKHIKTLSLTNDAGLQAQKSALRYFVMTEEIGAKEGSFYALYRDYEAVYNNTGIDVEHLRSRSSVSKELYFPTITVSLEDHYFCMTGFSISDKPNSVYAGDKYHVYVVRDITEIIGKISRFIDNCVKIGLAAVLFCISAIILFLKYALRPLETLNMATEEIASGNYENRICLRNGNKRKKDELAILSDSFNKMADAVNEHIRDVEDSARRQKMMLAAIAHEIRTPVTAISGYAYSLMNAELNNAQHEEAVNFIDEESRRLSRLSEKLRTLVGIEHSSPSFSEINAGEWKSELLRILNSVSKLKLIIDFSEGTVIPGDRDMLTILMTNLCSNAERAGADKVYISFQNGILSVSDNGCGIGDEILSRITEPFFVGDRSRSRLDHSKNDGFGLGLTICKQIAELHKSGLTFTASEYGGTTVAIDLNPLFTYCLQRHDDFKT